MTSSVQSRLLTAVYACMRPVARILLRSGVSYKQFADVSKKAFVHESLAEKDSKGRPINTSRIAVRTGLSRKEVRRLLEDHEPSESSDGILSHSGPPAKVLHAWHMDRRFLSNDGVPMDLYFDLGTPTFCDLVKAVAGDVPPGAVRAELKRAGAVEDLENGLMRVTKRYFVPGDFDEKAIAVLSGILYPLAAGIEHNSNPLRRTDGFIQRFAYSDKLGTEKVAQFRKWARSEATEFVESMDDWLATNESEDSPGSSLGRPSIAGVGVFYFEGAPADEVGAALNESQTGHKEGLID